MANFILIFFCLILGMLLKKTGKMPARSHQAFNTFVIYISLPATIFVQIPKLLGTTALSAEMLIPVSMAWITFLLAYLVFVFLAKKMRLNRPEVGALVLTAGLGNTSFVGFPLLEALVGPQAIPTGVIVDQLGSFLVLSTMGLVFASAFSPNSKTAVTAKSIFTSVFTFPPFLALIGAGIWYVSGTSDSPILIQVFDRLAGTLVPLALVSVGLQLRVSPPVLRKYAKPLAYGLLFKLILVPAFFLVLYTDVIGSRSQSTYITLLESAMASMITAGVVAEEFGFDGELSSLMVGVGIPISIATVLLWKMIFNSLGVPQ